MERGLYRSPSHYLPAPDLLRACDRRQAPYPRRDLQALQEYSRACCLCCPRSFPAFLLVAQFLTRLCYPRSSLAFLLVAKSLTRLCYPRSSLAFLPVVKSLTRLCYPRSSLAFLLVAQFPARLVRFHLSLDRSHLPPRALQHTVVRRSQHQILRLVL